MNVVEVRETNCIGTDIRMVEVLVLRQRSKDFVGVSGNGIYKQLCFCYKCYKPKLSILDILRNVINPQNSAYFQTTPIEIKPCECINYCNASSCSTEFRQKDCQSLQMH
jgi:hypothetical protein